MLRHFCNNFWFECNLLYGGSFYYPYVSIDIVSIDIVSIDIVSIDIVSIYSITILGTGAKWIATLEDRDIRPGKVS